jgi:hypothetical protein
MGALIMSGRGFIGGFGIGLIGGGGVITVGWLGMSE